MLFWFKKQLKHFFYSNTSYKSYHSFLYNKWNKKANHIFIACLPKSGSTFLANTIVNATNFEFIQFQPIRGTNDHNLNESIMLLNLNKNTVTQLHTKPNDFNTNLFKKYNIKVVFLYRSIIDSLKSFHHHILNENNQWFMFSVAKDFEQWTIEKQFDFLIDLVIPWYINFLVSWKNEIKKKEIDILEIEFEEFKNNNVATINKILKFYNLNFKNNQTDEAIKQSYTNKEKLRVTNSKEKIEYNLTNLQVDRIKKHINYYTEYNIKL